MDIIITLNIVGIDQGPLFDLYSDVDGFTTAFDTNVAEASLTSGYTASAPVGTTIVRVCGSGPKCDNCLDITPRYTTTTTTTTSGSSTTTTTTTAAAGFFVGSVSSLSDPTTACGKILDTGCWIDTTSGSTSLTPGDTVYTDPGGVSPFVGDGDFYNLQFDDDVSEGINYSVQIDGSGVIQAPINTC